MSILKEQAAIERKTKDFAGVEDQAEEAAGRARVRQRSPRTPSNLFMGDFFPTFSHVFFPGFLQI